MTVTSHELTNGNSIELFSITGRLISRNRKTTSTYHPGSATKNPYHGGVDIHEGYTSTHTRSKAWLETPNGDQVELFFEGMDNIDIHYDDVLSFTGHVSCRETMRGFIAMRNHTMETFACSYELQGWNWEICPGPVLLGWPWAVTATLFGFFFSGFKGAAGACFWAFMALFVLRHFRRNSKYQIYRQEVPSLAQRALARIPTPDVKWSPGPSMAIRGLYKETGETA